METKICNEFIPRNATMQYALANTGERIKLHDNLKEVLDEVRHAGSIMELLCYCDLSDIHVIQALGDNLKCLADLIGHIEGDLYMVTEYGLCTQFDKVKAIRDRRKCVEKGLCDGKCNVCNDGWAVGGECKCNIIGSDGYKELHKAERGDVK